MGVQLWVWHPTRLLLPRQPARGVHELRRDQPLRSLPPQLPARPRTSFTSRSVLSIVPLTAFACAASIRARSYGELTAHSADTLFGALYVTSIPATRVPFPPAARRGSPVAGDSAHHRAQLRAADALLGGEAQGREHPRGAVPSTLRHHPAAGVPAGVVFVAGVVVPAGRCRGQVPREALGVVARDLVCRLHPSARVPTLFTSATALAEIGNSAWLSAPHRITLNTPAPWVRIVCFGSPLLWGGFARLALWGPRFVLRLVAFSTRRWVRDARCSRRFALGFWGLGSCVSLGRACRGRGARAWRRRCLGLRVGSALRQPRGLGRESPRGGVPVLAAVGLQLLAAPSPTAIPAQRSSDSRNRAPC